jgi:A/G-specific adenine glycosylase
VEGTLLAWFAEHGRDLPWRRTRDPYAILVSEVMLQQTQVARVVPRYRAWLERWPTVETLAAAPLSDVIRAWQGLGYNRRAVNLHRAAERIARDGWPEDLTALPGVGRYTADALAAFALGRPVLPVDTNVARVLARTRASFGPRAAQALFDLGATVCLARVPRCSVCPLAAGFRAAAQAGPARGLVPRAARPDAPTRRKRRPAGQQPGRRGGRSPRPRRPRLGCERPRAAAVSPNRSSCRRRV